MTSVETMVEEGVVERVENSSLFVRVKRPSACGGCAARGACTTFGPSERIVRVERSPDAPDVEPGDRVTLEIRSVTFLGATFLSYLIPTLAFFAAVLLVYVSMDPAHTVWGLPRDMLAFLAGIISVLLAWVVIGALGGRSGSRGTYSPRIVSVTPAGTARGD